MSGRGLPWLPRENQVIRDHYRHDGIRKCAELLPGRTDRAIREQASSLGVKRSLADVSARGVYQRSVRITMRPATIAEEVVKRINHAAPGMRVRLAIDPECRNYITTQLPGGAALQVIPGTCGIYAAGARKADIINDIRERLRELAA